jgi:ribosomal protein L40E
MSAKKEETLVQTTSYLGENENQEFLLGPVSKGDIIRVLVSASEGNEYLISLHTFNGVTLFSTRVKGGRAVTFQVPASNEFLKLLVECVRWVERGEELIVTAERAFESSPFKGKVCPNCGVSVEPEAKFCWKCGTKLGS